MPRNVSTALAAHLASPGRTICLLLKITPKTADEFGITTGNRDETYDDGLSIITYRAKRGYTASDIVTKADLSVNNAEAHGLIAQYPLDGVTMEGIARGDYDGAKFVQYLINYEDHSMGHVVINFGTIGQIKRTDDLACMIELRSPQQILKQNSMISLTSITDRARHGDAESKLRLVWYRGVVTAVGAEADRTFTFAPLPAATATNETFLTAAGGETSATLTIDGDEAVDPVVTAIYKTASSTTTTLVEGTDYTLSGDVVTFLSAATAGDVYSWDGSGNALNADEIKHFVGSGGTAPAPANNGIIDPTAVTTTMPTDAGDYAFQDDSCGHFFEPGVVAWDTGASAGHEIEVESFDPATNTVTMILPGVEDIEIGDTLRIRQDCDGSRAMLRDRFDNILNARAEFDLPRADGTDLMSPTPSAG
jgi:uncharacterized phage protein (TIGR02218 family)